MFFSDIPLSTFLLLMIPAIVNLYAIHHAMRRQFPREGEQKLWLMLSVLLPILGGIIYFIFGMRRGILFSELDKQKVDETNNKMTVTTDNE